MCQWAHSCHSVLSCNTFNVQTQAFSPRNWQWPQWCLDNIHVNIVELYNMLNITLFCTPPWNLLVCRDCMICLLNIIGVCFCNLISAVITLFQSRPDERHGFQHKIFNRCSNKNLTSHGIDSQQEISDLWVLFISVILTVFCEYRFHVIQQTILSFNALTLLVGWVACKNCSRHDLLCCVCCHSHSLTHTSGVIKFVVNVN